MQRSRVFAYGIAIVAAAALLPGAVRAQAVDSLDAGQLYATRANLRAMLAKYEDASRTTAYTDYVRAIANDEADLIRDRLENGDFEVGDVITLQVSNQADLSNAFTVAPGRLMILPQIGAMPVGGLLRSELPDSVTSFIGRFYQAPQVYVQTSMRLQAVGEVGSPGYHSVSAEMRLPDVIAQLGQPTRTADLDHMKIKRGKETIWDGDALQEAIVQGRTMDQMSLRAGDIIEIPAEQKRNLSELVRSLYYLVPLSLLLTRLF
jgi:protein involved in polysaccharide export with SLBB domain